MRRPRNCPHVQSAAAGHASVAECSSAFSSRHDFTLWNVAGFGDWIETGSVQCRENPAATYRNAFGKNVTHAIDSGEMRRAGRQEKDAEFNPDRLFQRSYCFSSCWHCCSCVPSCCVSQARSKIREGLLGRPLASVNLLIPPLRWPESCAPPLHAHAQHWSKLLPVSGNGCNSRNSLLFISRFHSFLPKPLLAWASLEQKEKNYPCRLYARINSEVSIKLTQ